MKKKITYEYSSKGIEQNVIRYARSQNIPENWAKQIAQRVVKATDAWIENKDTVTEDDLRKVIYNEIKILDPDLAFAYKNHDKII
jgi:2-phosphoglycerate kinase